MREWSGTQQTSISGTPTHGYTSYVRGTNSTMPKGLPMLFFADDGAYMSDSGIVQIHFEVSKCMYMIVTPRQKLFYGGNPIYMM